MDLKGLTSVQGEEAATSLLDEGLRRSTDPVSRRLL